MAEEDELFWGEFKDDDGGGLADGDRSVPVTDAGALE